MFLLLLVLLSIIFLIHKYQNYEPTTKIRVTSKEKEWLTEFFQDVFLEGSAIYSLWGTKPLTKFEISYYTLEELEEIRQMYPPTEGSETIPVTRYTVADNWTKWGEIKDRFPMTNYMFFSRQFEDLPKIFFLYFVNKANVSAVLTANYELFRERTGVDFDTLKIISEIENPASAFWNQVFDDAELLGIMYGFGSQNAESFHKKYGKNEEIERVCFSDNLEVIGETDLDKFPIPIFASFSKNDPMITKYSLEREEIKRIYQNQDFVLLTLQQLTRNMKVNH